MARSSLLINNDTKEKKPGKAKAAVETDDDETDTCNFCGTKDPNDLIKRYMHVGLTRITLTIPVYTYRPVIDLKHI